MVTTNSLRFSWSTATHVILLVAFLLAVSTSRSSCAQLGAGIYADANNPSGAPDPIKPDSIWHVDPITGALSVTIPFTTTPTGGRGPKVPFSLHYNSASTITLQSESSSATIVGTGDSDMTANCSGNPFAPTACQLSIATGSNIPQGFGGVSEATEAFGWYTGPGFNSQIVAPAGPWTNSGPIVTSQFTAVANQVLSVGSQQFEIGYGCWMNGPYLYTDENGATHDMNLKNISNNSPTQTQAPVCANAPETQLTFGTWDGSALQTSTGSLTGTPQPIGPFGTAGPFPQVIYPDGTMFLGNMLEDSNGNKTTTSNSSGAVIDSLGRTVFSVKYTVGGTFTYPPTSVTTTAADGSNETYTIGIGSAPLGSFTMPHPTASEIFLNPNGCNNLSVMCLTSATVGQVNTFNGQASPDAVVVVNSVGLPNGTAYTFTYDPTYGTISNIQFPTGGSVNFVWGVRGDTGPTAMYSKLSSLVVTQVSVTSGSGVTSTWKYDFPDFADSTGLTSTITAPDGSYTDYTSTGVFLSDQLLYTLPGGSTAGETTWKPSSELTYSPTGVLLKSVSTVYESSSSSLQAANGLPTAIVTTLYDGATPLQQTVNYTYDSYANVIEKDESDFYACTGTPCPISTAPTWLRKTYTNYLWSNPASTQPAYNYTQAHIVNKPSRVLVTDGSGNPKALTIYTYDESGRIGSSPTGLSTHDDVNYGSGSTLPRGNLTTETRCTAVSGTVAKPSCGTSDVTWYYYDLTGQLTSRVQSPGTSIAETIGYTWGGQDDGFLQSIQYPNGATDSYTYYTLTGAMASHKDWNLQTTNYSYTNLLTGVADKLNRIGTITLPITVDGTTGSTGQGSTTYTYTDTPGAVSIQKQRVVNTSGTTTSVTTNYDGLGRVVDVSTVVPTSECSSSIQVLTVYDVMDRVESVTNPYCQTSDPTYGVTQFGYDYLSRKTDQIDSDGKTESWNYSGNTITFTDEVTNQWKRTSDGLGRLTQVLEPNGTTTSPSMETDYTYDALNDLTSVTQWGGPNGSTGARSRSFTYDSLSRLVSASNPESGAVTYTYDTNGNVSQKASPLANATSGTQLTLYCYDGLNRLTYEYTYNGAVTCTNPPSYYDSVFAYDGNLIAGSQFTGTKFSNPQGHLTDEQELSGSTLVSEKVPYQYDAVGRLLAESVSPYTPSGSTYSLTDSFDLAGDVTSTSNSATNITLSYRYDSAARFNALTSSLTSSGTTTYPGTLYSIGSYGPAGLTQATYAGDPNSTGFFNLFRYYDKRERVVDNEVYANTDAFGTAAVTIYGSENLCVSGSGSSCVAETGSVSISVGSVTATAQFSANSTPTTIADSLAALFNQNSSSQVSATVSANGPECTGGLFVTPPHDPQVPCQVVYFTAIVIGQYGNLALNAYANSSSSTFQTYASGTALSGGTGTPQGGNSAYVYTLGYDGASNLKTSTDPFNGSWNYSYDTLNRLKSATDTGYQGPGYVTSAGTVANQCWNYDSFGNRTFELDSASACPASLSQSTSTHYENYNGNNQISGSDTLASGPIYDAAGNVLHDALNNYLYDAKGRLCAVENLLTTGATEYAYDADGRRVAKGTWTGINWPAAGNTWAAGAVPNCSAPTVAKGFTATAVYLRDDSGRQDVEIDPAVGSSLAGWHQNVFADGGLLATYTDQAGSAPALFFSFSDWLGTKRLEVNALGQATNFWGSDPFGDYLTAHVTANDPSEHHFTGKERDAESGNDYFGARYYASTMGRFLSPDWSAKADPVPYAKLDDPQSLNLYGYMLNNPLGGVDADGHLPFGFAGPIILTLQQQQDIAVGALKGFGRVLFSAFSMTDSRITNPAYAHMQEMPASLQYSNTTQAVAGTVAPLLVSGFGGSVTVTASAAPAIETEAATISAEIPEVGQDVFRVWGGESGPFGHSWTPMNPESVSNFRDAAGLPNVNTGTQMTTGTLTDTTGVTSRSALPLDGNKGGAPEYLVPKPKEQIQIKSIKDNTDHPM